MVFVTWPTWRKARIKPPLSRSTRAHIHTLKIHSTTLTHSHSTPSRCALSFTVDPRGVQLSSKLRIHIPASTLNPGALVSDPRRWSPPCLATVCSHRSHLCRLTVITCALAALPADAHQVPDAMACEHALLKQGCVSSLSSAEPCPWQSTRRQPGPGVRSGGGGRSRRVHGPACEASEEDFTLSPGKGNPSVQ